MQDTMETTRKFIWTVNSIYVETIEEHASLHAR